MNMNTKALAFLVSLFVLPPVALVSATDLQHDRVLLKEGFNGVAETGLAKALLAHRHISLAKGAGPDRSDAIRVAYVGYNGGSQRVVSAYPLRAKVEQATISFDVRFAEDFQWTLGGKLHGLGPKRPVTGGKERRPDGWSARTIFQPKGHCASYLYDQDKSKTYGVGQKSDEPVFVAGRWHHVALQVSLNDSSRSNGWSCTLIDNQVVIKSENIKFRGSGESETLIQKFLFCTFHGGHTPKWTPVDRKGNPTTVYAYFDNFIITEGIQQSPADNVRHKKI